MSVASPRYLYAMALAVMIASAGGEAPAQSLSDIAMMSGPDRQAKLEAGAKKEAQFALYTTLIPEGSEPLRDAFVKKYPFLKFDLVRANNAQLVQRLIAESRAKKGAADVVMGGFSDAMDSAQLIAPFASPEFAAYPKEYVGKGNLWFMYRMASFGIGYNTKLLQGADIPKSYEDLVDPKYRGHMIWGNSRDTGATFLVNHWRSIWDPKKAETIFDGLSKQQIARSNASVRALLDLVIAGEHKILITTSLNHVIDSASQGAPVWFTSPDPVPTRSDHVMLAKEAPHPHAAMLFLDYLLSKEGQTVLTQNAFQVARPDVEPTAIQRPIIPHFNGRTAKAYSSQDFEGKEEALETIVNRISP